MESLIETLFEQFEKSLELEHKIKKILNFQDLKRNDKKIYLGNEWRSETK